MTEIHEKCGRGDEITTCGSCEGAWCDRCDPAHGPLCPWCHGRGYSTAEIQAPRYRQANHVLPDVPVRWVAMVEVEAATVEQARQVLRERLYFDEELEDEETGEAFDYRIDVAAWPVEKVTA